MCNLSDKLIAWLDHELPPHEAAGLQQHVEACEECRRCLATYKELDRAIHAYCDAAIQPSRRPILPRLTPVLSVAAAAVALLLLFPHPRVDRHPPQIEATGEPPAALENAHSQTVPVPVMKHGHRRHAVAPAQSQATNAKWVPAEPSIQIAIPVEAMFAPGAVPQGVTFTAELSIAADGSAQQLRLRP